MLRIEVIMENIIYFKGVPVGIEFAGRILFYTGASKEAVDFYAKN